MPVPSLPFNICEAIAAYIHHQAGKGHEPYTLKTARATHSQLSLASKAWLELSRGISFEDLSIRSPSKILKFFRLVEDSKGACTFMTFVRRISFGAAEGMKFSSHQIGYYGWLGDFFDFNTAVHLFPNLFAIEFRVLDIPFLREMREFRRIMTASVFTGRGPLTNISQLSLRTEFFGGLAPMYDFLYEFPALEGIIIGGITDAFLDTLPFHLPPTVESIQLIENQTGVVRGQRFYRPCTKMIRQPARNDVALHAVQYVHLTADQSLRDDKAPFFMKMSQHTSILHIHFPDSTDDEERGAWAFLVQTKLHEHIIHGIADVCFYDSTQMKVKPENIPRHREYKWAADLHRQNAEADENAAAEQFLCSPSL